MKDVKPPEHTHGTATLRTFGFRVNVRFWWVCSQNDSWCGNTRLDWQCHVNVCLSVALLLQIFGSPSTPVLENPEYQTRWYFKYFLGKCKYLDAFLPLDRTIIRVFVHKYGFTTNETVKCLIKKTKFLFIIITDIEGSIPEESINRMTDL
jgi:hypothetical protein